MPGTIDRDGLRRLMDTVSPQIVEVLPEPEYRAAHLPGALHLPLKGLGASAAHRVLATDRPVIVYCNDFL